MAIDEMRSNAPPTLKPGMSHTINAGESISISDVNDEEIVIEARDDPRVLDFIAAFSAQRSAHLSGIGGQDAHARHARLVEAAFMALPTRVRLLIPSNSR